MFSQEHRNQLKKQLQRLQAKTIKLKQVVYQSYSISELMRHLESAIGHDFEILMVHASYQGMLPMYLDSPARLVEGLIAFCQKYDITLAMPAFFFGRNTQNHIEFYRKHSKFNVNRTPSKMGLISEMFRRTEGVKRSLHPSHSVCALGPLADEIVKTHHTCGTTFGEGSPFDVMAKYNTRILGMGVKYFRCLTQVHTAEDLLKDDYPVKAEQVHLNVQMTNEKNETEEMTFCYRIFPDKVRDATILGKLLKRNELMEWSFHGVSFFSTIASRVTNVLCEAASKNQSIYR